MGCVAQEDAPVESNDLLPRRPLSSERALVDILLDGDKEDSTPTSPDKAAAELLSQGKCFSIPDTQKIMDHSHNLLRPRTLPSCRRCSTVEFGAGTGAEADWSSDWARFKASGPASSITTLMKRASFQQDQRTEFFALPARVKVKTHLKRSA